MRRYAFAVIGLFALCGAARADGTGCAPSQPADPVGDYQRLVDCVKRSVADAQNGLDVLRDLGIDEFGGTADRERTQFEALVKSRSDALGQATDQIAALVAERDDLKRQLAQAHQENDALKQKIVVIDGELQQLAADLRAAQAQNDKDAGTISAQQAVIDKLKGQLEKLDADLIESQQQQAALQRQIEDLTKAVDDAKAATAQEAADLSAKIADLKTALSDTDGKNAALKAALVDSGTKIDELKTALEGANAKVAELEGKIEQLNTALKDDQSTIDKLNTTIVALNGTITELEGKLKHAEGVICTLTDRLAPFSAEFAVELHAVLGDDPSIAVVGNRLIVNSEVFFQTGSAVVNTTGRQTVAKSAAFIKAFQSKIPGELGWLVQVNGHTDKRPINTRQFPSNWELSTARAVSVVKLLAELGIPPDHLAASGFGEFQPLSTGKDAASLQRNRRIEIELVNPGVFGFAQASGSVETSCSN